MPLYAGHAGTILRDDIIVGSVGEWHLQVHRAGDEVRWMGSLIWQWFTDQSGTIGADEFQLELNDGSKTPSFELAGRTVFMDIDACARRIEFRGRGDLEGLPDPAPNRSEIDIT